MKNLILISFLIVCINFFGQTDKIYIATAKMNKNIENYFKYFNLILFYMLSKIFQQNTHFLLYGVFKSSLFN